MDRTLQDIEYSITKEQRDWINNYYGPRAIEILYGIYDFQSIRKSVLAKYHKLNKIRTPTYIFLTLSPDKYLRNMDNTPENKKALYDWCHRWFHHNPKYYNGVKWIIECGSDASHLHVHAICDMKSSHKHAEYLKKHWNKTFPKNNLIISNKKKGNEYDSHTFTDPIILKDKLEYFENDLKGTHSNLIDLGLGGSIGVLSDISLEHL